MHEINVYPQTRLACRQEAKLKALRKEARQRINNKDQHASDLDLSLADGMLDEPIKLAAKEIRKYAKQEIPTRYHQWLTNMPHFPSLQMLRIIAELGARIDLAPGPRSLRHICGIFPHNGRAVRNQRGQASTFDSNVKGLFLSPKHNGLLTQIRLHGAEPWTSMREERKQYLNERGDNPPKSKLWIDRTSGRWLAQQIINELWEVAHLEKPRRWM